MITIYDVIYLFESVLTITIKYYLVIIAYRFVKEKRNPKLWL